MSFFCGLDWGVGGRAACLVDELGGIAARFDVEHDTAGLTANA
jgi:hypothetical protein